MKIFKIFTSKIFHKCDFLKLLMKCNIQSEYITYKKHQRWSESFYFNLNSFTHSLSIIILALFILYLYRKNKYCKRNQGTCQIVIPVLFSPNSCVVLLLWAALVEDWYKLVNYWDTKVLFHSPQFILYLGLISYNHSLLTSALHCVDCHLS